MKTLRGFADTMSWTTTGKRMYALHAGSDVVATLHWPHGFGSPARAETAEDKVTIERSGLLRPRVLVRDDAPAAAAPDGDAPASQRAPRMTLEVDLGGRGVARGREGRTLQWSPRNLWRTTWAFEENGKTLVTFESDSALMTFGHKVKVAGDTADLGTIVLLGSAVGVFLSEDAAIFGI
jgi:hypothetical protein